MSRLHSSSELKVQSLASRQGIEPRTKGFGVPTAYPEPNPLIFESGAEGGFEPQPTVNIQRLSTITRAVINHGVIAVHHILLVINLTVTPCHTQQIKVAPLKVIETSIQLIDSQLGPPGRVSGNVWRSAGESNPVLRLDRPG